MKVAMIHITEEWRTSRTIELERLPAVGDLIWTSAEERRSGTDMFVVERIMHAEKGTNSEDVVYIMVTPYTDFGHDLPRTMAEHYAERLAGRLDELEERIDNIHRQDQ